MGVPRSVGAPPLMILLHTRRRCPSLFQSASSKTTTATHLTCWRSTATQRYSASRVAVRLTSPATLIMQWAPIKGWNHGWAVAIMPRPVRNCPHAAHHATLSEPPMPFITPRQPKPPCRSTTRCSHTTTTNPHAADVGEQPAVLEAAGPNAE